MSKIISILAGIGDLQATLSSNAVADESVMEQLNEIRKKALTILKQENETSLAAESYRHDAMEKACALGDMINAGVVWEDMPDFTLFRMAAAADNFASAVKTYLKMRNLLAAEKSWRTGQEEEV